MRPVYYEGKCYGILEPSVFGAPRDWSAADREITELDPGATRPDRRRVRRHPWAEVTRPGVDDPSASTTGTVADRASHAIATHRTVPGYVDFLAADGRRPSGRPTRIASRSSRSISRGRSRPSRCRDPVVRWSWRTVRCGWRVATNCRSIRLDLASRSGHRQGPDRPRRCGRGAQPGGRGGFDLGAEQRRRRPVADRRRQQRGRRPDRRAPRLVLRRIRLRCRVDHELEVADRRRPARCSASIPRPIGSSRRSRPARPRFLAAGEGGVWTLNWGDGSVTRIDPAANRPTDLPLGMGRGWRHRHGRRSRLGPRDGRPARVDRPCNQRRYRRLRSAGRQRSGAGRR